MFHKVENRLVLVGKHKLCLDFYGFLALSGVSMFLEDTDGRGRSRGTVYTFQCFSVAELAPLLIFKVCNLDPKHCFLDAMLPTAE